MDTLLAERETMPLTTREQFAASIQEPFGYLMGCFFSLSFEGQGA